MKNGIIEEPPPPPAAWATDKAFKNMRSWTCPALESLSHNFGLRLEAAAGI